MITTRPAAEDIASIIETADLGHAGSDMFVNSGNDVAAAPDSMIIVSDYPFQRPPDPNGDYEYCMVQIRVRRKAYDFRGGISKVLSLMNCLDRYCGTVSDIYYSGIFVTSGPLFLGSDDKNRPNWSFNAEAQRTIVEA